ncbi:MAG: hypothetical protein ACE37F_19230 [Nannocystaceae bacterium]|nr:hypothetical protein [bacterium]
MSSRPGWAVTLLWLCSCGEEAMPPWLLTEEPRLLGARVEVVEPGPLSDGLLPIPADRVRSQALPGDTVEVSAWAYLGREGDTAEAEPAWFMCPRTGGCVAPIGRSSGPCGESVPERVACRLPDGERVRVVVPPLDVDLPFEDQVFIRLAFVGHADASMTTQECIETISDPSALDWGPCIVGYRGITLGPAPRFVGHALDLGFELPEGLATFVGEDVVPPYNPEAVPIELRPYYGVAGGDPTRAVIAAPGQVAVLEPGQVYTSRQLFDPKDIQTVVEFSGEYVAIEDSVPARTLSSATPGVVALSEAQGWEIWTPNEPSEFSVNLVLSDRAGGAAWGAYRFEVREP